MRYSRKLFKIHQAYRKHNYTRFIWRRPQYKETQMRQCACGAMSWFDNNNIEIGMSTGWVNSANAGHDGVDVIDSKAAACILRHFKLLGIKPYDEPT